MNMHYVCKDEKLDCKYSFCEWTFWAPQQQTVSEPIFKNTTTEQAFVYLHIHESYLRSPPILSGPKCLSLEYSAESANIMVYVSSEDDRKEIVKLASSTEIIMNKIDLKGKENSSVIVMIFGVNATIKIYNIALQEGTCNDETIHVDFDMYPDTGWKISSTDTRYIWTRRTGGEAKSFNERAGPFFDHSTSQGNGSYLTLEVTNYVYVLDARELYVNATFESPAYFKTGSNDSRSWSISCLQFWYYIYGDNSSTLNVYRISKDGKRQILSTIRNNEPVGIWKKHSLTIANSTDIRIEFEGTISKNRSSIALDDIAIKHGRCPEENHFTYIIKTGPLYVKSSSAAKTLPCFSQLSNEDRVSIGFRPDSFLTTSDEYKKCKTIEKEIEKRFNNECKRRSTNAEIIECVQQMLKDNEQCMKLPSTINVDYICLEIYGKLFETGQPLVINCNKHQYQATVQLVNISIQDLDKTCPYSKDVAIKLHDLLTETNQRCNTETTCEVAFPTLEPTYRAMHMYYVCKDDENLDCKNISCSWTSEGFNLLAPTQSMFTDTTNKQAFAYSTINGSNFRSPPLMFGPKCLSLRYSSVSADIVIYSETNGTKDPVIEKLLPSKELETVQLDFKSNDNTVVIIMMIIADRNVSDMPVYIYNIGLKEGTCNDYRPIYINFDISANGWTRSSTDTKYGWIRRNGNESNSYYGQMRPFFDHSTAQGSGYFLTFEVTDHTEDAKEKLIRATFESPVYFGNDISGSRSWTIVCLQFWYYMYGGNSSTLIVWKKLSDRNKQILSSIPNTEPVGIWKKHSLTVTNLTDITIAFEGVIGKTRSSIALDDISVKYGRCPEETIFTNTMRTGPLCQEPSSTPSTLSCISQLSNENRVNIGFEPDISQTNTDEYKKCKEIEKEIEIRFNEECIRKRTIAEITECGQQLQRDIGDCMILPSEINADYICLGKTQTQTTTPGTTLQDEMGSTQSTSSVADTQYTTNLLHQSSSTSSSKEGIIIGVICGIVIVFVAVLCVILVMKRSTILQNLKRTTTDVDVNTFKMDKHVSTNGNKDIKKANQQYNECHKSGNFEHVYNSIEGESGTENNIKNRSKYQIENRVPCANEIDGYAVIKGVDIYDQITHDEQKGSNSKALSSAMNLKQFENEQSNDYVVLKPNESGYERKGKNQNGIRCFDEENHDYQTLTPNEVETGPMDNKIEKNNDYGILDPNETGFDRSDLSILTENKTLHVDMGSKVTPKLASEDYSVLDLNETGFNCTNRSTEINKTGFNPTKRKPEFNTSDEYTILDPTATGFCRTPDANRPIDNPSAASVQDNDMTYEKAQAILHPYELAKPIEQANANAKEDIDKNKGQQTNYDHDVNIYSHCVDDVYDVSSHVRKKAERDSTYGYPPNKKN